MCVTTPVVLLDNSHISAETSDNTSALARRPLQVQPFCVRARKSAGGRISRIEFFLGGVTTSSKHGSVEAHHQTRFFCKTRARTSVAPPPDGTSLAHTCPRGCTAAAAVVKGAQQHIHAQRRRCHATTRATTHPGICGDRCRAHPHATGRRPSHHQHITQQQHAT